MEPHLPRLDPRLWTLAQLVRPGARCADVGCDHGYLIAWLCASGKIPGGYACDINSKPLEKAAFTLSQCGVSHQVKTVRCNGLEGVGPGQVEDVVIAGMGGDLIWRILDACPWSRDPSLRFVLQPMTKIHRLRQLLYANGFVLLQERAVAAGEFVYTAMPTPATAGKSPLCLPGAACCWMTPVRRQGPTYSGGPECWKNGWQVWSGPESPLMNRPGCESSGNN